MKKLLYILPAAALMLGLQSCSDDDFSKHSIDAEHQTGTQTTTGITAAPVVVDFETASFSVTVSSIEDVIEEGIQVSKSEDFSNPIFFAYGEGELATSFQVEANGLEGSTKYYARSYVLTKNGGYVFGNVQTFTTPKTPIYELEGYYTMLQYYAGSSTDYEFVPDTYEDENGETQLYIYPIAIFKDEESVDGTDVFVYNLWDVGIEGVDPVYGAYDEESQTVSMPNQVIGSHPVYGPLAMRGVNDGITAYTNGVDLKFTPMKGVLKSTNFNVYVSAGSFGYYYIDGAHDPDEE